MLKIVDLPDGKQISLRSSAATAILYKNQFGTDFFADMIMLAKTFGAIQGTGDGDDFDMAKLSYDDLQHLDMTTLYKVTWAFAKNADNSVGDLESWLGQFDEFPLDIVLSPVMELVQKLFSTSKN